MNARKNITKPGRLQVPLYEQKKSVCACKKYVLFGVFAERYQLCTCTVCIISIHCRHMCVQTGQSVLQRTDGKIVQHASMWHKTFFRRTV